MLKVTRSSRTLWMLSVVLVGGCVAESGTAHEDVEASEQALHAGEPVSFAEFEDPQGTSEAGSEPMKRLIRSEFEYRRLFGHRSPGIDFRREVVVFYSAGTKNSGGYQASIPEITRSGSRLYVTTSLSSPGADCRVTLGLARPSVLVRAKAQRVRSVRYTSQDVTVDCPVEVPCGGITGASCPGGGTCEDDPSDTCDPNQGGADCGGSCRCLQLALCIRGYIFDSSAEVCACVPDPNVPRCAGFIGLECPAGLECIDDPSDDCDPNNGGADCGGLCVPGPTGDPCATVRCAAGTHCVEGRCEPDEAPVFCGGIANIQCPGIGLCEDDPYDGCDPSNGGADCGGVCTCEALAKCPADYTFDRSPTVCNCVKPEPENPCNLVDCIPNTVCIVLDGEPRCVSDGSLACGENTCGKGSVCCNSSCGICTEPDMACIQIACL